jgi:hypothetical protein
MERVRSLCRCPENEIRRFNPKCKGVRIIYTKFQVKSHLKCLKLWFSIFRWVGHEKVPTVLGSAKQPPADWESLLSYPEEVRMGSISEM